MKKPGKENFYEIDTSPEKTMWTNILTDTPYQCFKDSTRNYWVSAILAEFICKGKYYFFKDLSKIVH